MDHIKFDVEKEKNLGIPAPDMVMDIFKGSKKMVIAITANVKTLEYTDVIKKRLKVEHLNMVQIIENNGMREGVLLVTYNKGKEKEIEIDVEKATKKN